jgi:hypothetical protein
MSPSPIGLARVGNELARNGVIRVRGIDKRRHRRRDGDGVARADGVDFRRVFGRDECRIGQIIDRHQGSSERGHAPYILRLCSGLASCVPVLPQ